MKNLLLCYPKCTTCAKARRWLAANNIDFSERHIKDENPTEAELRKWVAVSGKPLKRFFNTSGQSYKSLGLSKKLASMSEDEQFAILATDGMLVKRPILLTGDKVLVGFDEGVWSGLPLT